MKIPDSTLEQLNAQADLVAIIRRHTILKPAGREFKGCCPFHGEKTPSFYVNPQTNLYYCFGCGARGNAISFLVDYEKLTFIEAVKELADKTGIELPKDDSAKLSYQRTSQALPAPSSQATAKAGNAPSTPPQTQNQNQTPNQSQAPSQNPNSPDDSTAPVPSPAPVSVQVPDFYRFLDGTLYGLLLAVSAFYEHQLHQNPTATNYLVSRGLSFETIGKFGLGYAPKGWQHLEKTFPNDLEGLRMLGLVRTSQAGREFDLFRERIMFPIKDRQGRVVGFAGRAMSDETTPKYLNSSDSVVFAKQHILYGFYESRQAKASDWLVVEGYMDVISLYQAGIYGAVAPMGTAVNENQIASLLKFNDSLTLCFDGDGAGQRASLRALEVAMPVLTDGKTLKFLTLPDNHDPDTYVKTYGKDKTLTAIKNAKSLSDYLYHVLATSHELALPEQKATAMAKLKELTAKLPKGSTFRSWLNNDIYQRLRNATADKRFTKNSQTANLGSIKPLLTTPPPTRSEISQTDELLLCLLYQPALVANDQLEHLYTNAGVFAIDQSFSGKLTPPPLPTWQTLANGVGEVIDAISTALPFLNTSNSPEIIDANAHLILSGLGNAELQKGLGEKWRDFFYSTQHHQDERIELLFAELLCQLIITKLKAEQQVAQGLALASLYKKRLLALEKWNKQHIKPAIEQGKMGRT